jgi:hypothetical protein
VCVCAYALEAHAVAAVFFPNVLIEEDQFDARTLPYHGLLLQRDSVSRDCGEDQFFENKDKVKILNKV